MWTAVGIKGNDTCFDTISHTITVKQRCYSRGSRPSTHPLQTGVGGRWPSPHEEGILFPRMAAAGIPNGEVLSG
jgi:hypothetical protein